MYFLVIILAFVVIFWYARNIEGFSAGAAFYSDRDLRGAHSPAIVGHNVLLHDGTWRVWSCQAPENTVIRVTAEGMTEVLYLRANRVDNLPAALGGLPAHENYTTIFGSGRRIMVAFVPAAEAERAVANAHAQCVATNKYSVQTCAQEYVLA